MTAFSACSSLIGPFSSQLVSGLHLPVSYLIYVQPTVSAVVYLLFQ